MRTGDVIRHIPSGERWLVAWADEQDVICCGWPESIARRSDCKLITAATDEQHLEYLRKVAEECPEQARGQRCQAELDRIGGGAA